MQKIPTVYPPGKPTRYCIKISDGRWIKRTAQFGYAHGSILLTKDPEERRWWTRERDARHAALTFDARVQRRGSWSGISCPEIEWKKLGLTAEVSF